MIFSERCRNLPQVFGTRGRLPKRVASTQTLSADLTHYMFNDAEKEELKRIVNRFVEQRRCFRPIHPDEVMKEVNRFKATEGCQEEVESAELQPRFHL